MLQTLWERRRFKAPAYGLKQLQRVVARLDRQRVCEVVDPRALDPVDLVHGRAALWGEADEFGAPVMRISVIQVMLPLWSGCNGR